jgi:hypothetical protein
VAITTVKRLVNHTAGDVVFTDHEGKRPRSTTVPRHEEVELDWNVPWCTSPGEFADGHRLTIVVRTPARTFSIWQNAETDGDYVRLSTDGRYHGENDGGVGRRGDHVPGNPAVGGARTVRIGEQGDIEFRTSQ